MDLIIYISLICGILVYSSMQKHFLSMLLSLEFMVLALFISFFLWLNKGMVFYSLIYLTFTVCEGALGLSVLVGMSQSYGGDYLGSFSLNY